MRASTNAFCSVLVATHTTAQIKTITITSDAGGGGPGWEVTRQEREDTYFPSTSPEVSNIDRPSCRRSPPSAAWGGEPTGNTTQPQDYGSWKRTGYGSAREDSSFEGGAGESGGVPAARVASTGTGLVWPMHRGGAPAATTGAHQSRKKQS